VQPWTPSAVNTPEKFATEKRNPTTLRISFSLATTDIDAKFKNVMLYIAAIIMLMKILVKSAL
jgi:hypothetical protein